MIGHLANNEKELAEFMQEESNRKLDENTHVGGLSTSHRDTHSKNRDSATELVELLCFYWNLATTPTKNKKSTTQQQIDENSRGTRPRGLISDK